MDAWKWLTMLFSSQNVPMVSHCHSGFVTLQGFHSRQYKNMKHPIKSFTAAVLGMSVIWLHNTHSPGFPLRISFSLDLNLLETLFCLRFLSVVHNPFLWKPSKPTERIVVKSAAASINQQTCYLHKNMHSTCVDDPWAIKLLHVSTIYKSFCP